MKLNICLPTIIITSCMNNSNRQSPWSHCLKRKQMIIEMQVHNRNKHRQKHIHEEIMLLCTIPVLLK